MHPIDRELELIDRLYGGDVSFCPLYFLTLHAANRLLKSRYGASSSRYVKDQCEIEPTDSVSSIGTPALSPVRTASRSHMCNVPAHRLYDVEMGLEHNNHGIPLVCSSILTTLTHKR